MEEEMEQQLTITAGELMDSTYLSRSGIIKDFLPPGTYILAGQPKIGKSFFVTQLCWCVAEGQPFLGFETEPGTVLYLPLEDTEARLQSRMGKMFGTEWVGKRLHLMFHPKSKEGAAKDLAAFLKDHPETRVVVIDTLPAGFAAGVPEDPDWCRYVLDNCRRVNARFQLAAGEHKLRFVHIDAGVVLQKIEVAKKPSKAFYGYRATYRKK